MCPQTDSQGPVIQGMGRIGNTFEDIVLEYNFSLSEAGNANCAQQVCFLQTTGNSPGPQGNVIECRCRKRFGQDDIPDLKTAARL